MPQEIVLIIIGFVAGILAGMFGIGGGVVIVPALIGTLAFSIHQATGTSLAALLLPVGLFAVIEYHRKGFLSISRAALVAAGLVIGTGLGSLVAFGLAGDVVERLYGVFLIYVAWRFTEPLKWYAEYRNKLAVKEITPAEEILLEPKVAWYIILVVGFIAGICSGMFGIGGGVVIVPALVGLLHFDQKRAVGTSLGALLLPTSVLGVLKYRAEGALDFGVAALVALGLLFGALAGARIALGLPSSTVKRMYGIFLLFVAFRFMFPELFLN
jgi:uncharacterized protein